jgi:hypothetical protein
VFDADAGITKGEGLGARGVGVPRVGVLRWAEEPVEGNDGEVDDMTVGLALFGSVVLRTVKSSRMTGTLAGYERLAGSSLLDIPLKKDWSRGWFRRPPGTSFWGSG